MICFMLCYEMIWYFIRIMILYYIICMLWTLTWIWLVNCPIMLTIIVGKQIISTKLNSWNIFRCFGFAPLDTCVTTKSFYVDFWWVPGNWTVTSKPWVKFNNIFLSIIFFSAVTYPRLCSSHQNVLDNSLSIIIIDCYRFGCCRLFNWLYFLLNLIIPFFQKSLTQKCNFYPTGCQISSKNEI